MIKKVNDNYYIYTGSGVMCLGSNPTLQAPTLSSRCSPEAYKLVDKQLKKPNSKGREGSVGIETMMDRRKIYPKRGKGVYWKGERL